MRDIDRYRGCLIGGAVGDALGYVDEFLNASLFDFTENFQKLFYNREKCGIL